MRKNELTDHFKVEPGYWFVPKMFGYGATPVTWQGWALTIGYCVLIWLDVRHVTEMVARIGIAVALTALLVVIAARRTRGGWRWRWGGEDA